jgi:DNA-binding transcriptional regulator PaaX
MSEELWAFIGKKGFEMLKGLSRVHDFRVLIAFIERVDSQNLFHGSQVDIARDLGISSSSVNAVFKRLREAGIILKSRERGITFFHLNRDLGRKGHVKTRPQIYEKSYQDYRDEWLESLDSSINPNEVEENYEFDKDRK